MGWDPDEFGLDNEAADEATGPVTPEVAAALLGAIQVAQPVSPYARRMSAVEEKLTVAAYYKSVLDMDFFESRDQFTVRIETEIKDFVVKRIEALLNNVPAVAPEEQFTPEETKALKLWAKKLLAPKPAVPAVAPPPVVPPVAAPPPVTTPKKRRMAKVPGKPSPAAVEVAPAAPPTDRKRRQAPVRSATALPVPTGSAFTAASEMQARQQLASSPGASAIGEFISSQKE